MSDIPGENVFRRKKVGTDKKCCFGNCRSDSLYKSYLECTYYFTSFPKPCLKFQKGKIPDDSMKKFIKNCAECIKCDMWVMCA